MTTEEEIRHFEQYVGNECYTEKHQKSCEMAIAALSAQRTPAKLDRSQWEGCHYCVPSWCGTCEKYDVRNTGDPCTTSCPGYLKHKPVNFCKNCGRPLTEKAWAELERRIGGPDEN